MSLCLMLMMVSVIKCGWEGIGLTMNWGIAVHEAPVYSPVTNKLYFSQLEGKTSPPGFLPQLVVNLNVEPPYLGELLSDPPIYAPNGGTIHNGL